MLEAIPARVVGRIAQPEVRPEVDDGGAVGHEVRDEAGRRAVGEGEERGIDLRQACPDREVGRGQVRVVAADRVVLAVAAGESDDLDVRMARQQPDELGTDVPGGTDDADADPSRPAVRAHAPLGAGEEPRRLVRRDRRGRSEPRAHWRTWPLTGGWLGLLAGSGRTVVMGA